ncbi:phage tail protein [Occallatibacter riparius]|uniref:Tail fiber protein n=1 Tax=Occallatibacter riparius TaxID=1002689 RepID=A0A9J7BTC0_9BACT|nr:tail fiber protein [Occallatibacter riparius]UWZ86116.1 tail fiber protein [Occallatibacter riparius]
MSDPFLAEIRILPLNFAPKGWAMCDGQLMALSQNTALFSLLGTTYGGNGINTFALPNLQGCVPLQPGQGPGLSLYDLGESSGTQTVTLIQSEMPMHTHTLGCVDGTRVSGETTNPTNSMLAKAGGTTPPTPYIPPPSTPGQLNANVVGLAGGSQPHNNMMPFLTLNFCIALQGIFPARG